MSFADLFDDPRHRTSEQLAFEAERAERDRDPIAATLWARAAASEEELSSSIPAGRPKARSIFGISVVALYLRAQRWRDVKRVAIQLLAQPDEILPSAVAEVEAMLELAIRETALARVLDTLPGHAQVDLKLDGGRVRAGLAPASLTGEVRDVVQAALVRCGELLTELPFRRKGRSRLASLFGFYDAAAAAGSFEVRLVIAPPQRPEQPPPLFAHDLPQRAIDLFLELAASPDGARFDGLPVDYQRTLARALRDVSPDGVAFDSVALRSAGGRAVRLDGHAREQWAARLRSPTSFTTSTYEGVLKVVNLRGKKPLIAIEDGPTVSRFHIRKGEHDDTIGPKINRRVRVLGSDVPESDIGFADDVVLAEP